MDALLAQLSTSLPQAHTLDQLARPLLEMLGRVTGLESTYLTTIDRDADTQTIQIARNTGSLAMAEGLTVPWSDTLCKRALDSGCLATSQVDMLWADSEAARRLGIKTYMTSPIRGDGGELLGTLCAASPRREPIGGDAETLLRLFSTLVSQFLQRERLMTELRLANERLTTYALTDALTGLPNRRALFDDLQRLLNRAVRDGTSVLVGCIDLDGFKAINDRHGHQVGDRFLEAVAQRLSLELRGSDLLARMGGDEFVVVGPGADLTQWPAQEGALIEHGEPHLAARTLQQRATLATVGRFELGDQVLHYAGASVGVVALNPVGLSAEEALQLADARMYEVKRRRHQQAQHASAATGDHAGIVPTAEGGAPTSASASTTSASSSSTPSLT